MPTPAPVTRATRPERSNELGCKACNSGDGCITAWDEHRIFIRQPRDGSDRKRERQGHLNPRRETVGLRATEAAPQSKRVSRWLPQCGTMPTIRTDTPGPFQGTPPENVQPCASHSCCSWLWFWRAVASSDRFP